MRGARESRDVRPWGGGRRSARRSISTSPAGSSAPRTAPGAAAGSTPSCPDLRAVLCQQRSASAGPSSDDKVQAAPLGEARGASMVAASQEQVRVASTARRRSRLRWRAAGGPRRRRCRRWWAAAGVSRRWGRTKPALLGRRHCTAMRPLNAWWPGADVGRQSAGEAAAVWAMIARVGRWRRNAHA